MKKAQQEDLIILELLDKIEKIKVSGSRIEDSKGNVYELSDLLIFLDKNTVEKIIHFIIMLVAVLFAAANFADEHPHVSFSLIFLSVIQLGYYYFYRHNIYAYSHDGVCKYFSRKNQKQIRSIMMQVETKNILNSINN